MAQAFASAVRASSPRISAMRRCSALHRARHRRTSPGERFLGPGSSGGLSRENTCTSQMRDCSAIAADVRFDPQSGQKADSCTAAKRRTRVAMIYRSPRRRGPGCISAGRAVTAPTLEDFHDARKQGGSNHGVTFVGEMYKV
jgi:hypothetical protein